MTSKNTNKKSKMKSFIYKFVLPIVATVLIFTSASLVYASEHHEKEEFSPYIGFSPCYGDDCIDIGDVVPTGGNESVHKKCTKLAGLNFDDCELTNLGVDVCDEEDVVCNVDDLKKDSEIDDSLRVYYENHEKTDYCLLPEKHCYNENAWGEDGFEDYQNDQNAQAWAALEDGDLGGFLCHGMDGGTGGILGCEEGGEGGEGPQFILPIEETTFTQFDETGFEAPDADGYSEGLTQNHGVRDFVLNVVNFALGFLGLVGVVAIIYGGFIYLTAGGDESKTEKGKNSILFAVVGIIIILASFAIVRTVICYAPVGGDDKPSFCRAGGGGGTSAGEIELTETVGDSVQITFENAQRRLQDIATGALSVSTDYLNLESAAPYLSNIEYALQEGLDEGLSILGSLKNSVNDFPRSLSDINKMITYLSREEPTVSSSTVRRTAAADKKSFLARILHTDIMSTPTVGAPPTPSPTSSAGVPTAVGGVEPGPPAQALFTDVYSFMDHYSSRLLTSSIDDYNENFVKFLRFSDGLEKLFDGIDDARAEMEDVTEKLELLDDYGNRGDRDLLRDLVFEINEAVEVIKNLEFVDVALNSSERSCSAPCIVLFDSIGSTDPSGRTILNSDHYWDLNGDGVENSGTTPSCDESPKSTVSCIYEEPGTYIATLRIDSAEPTKYASGLAMTKIKVGRPLAKIRVGISSKTSPEVTAIDYLETPAIRSNRVRFTLEEARDGLLFDATGSVGSSEQDIEEYIWNFGKEQFAGANSSKEYSFTQRGNYRVVLEVVENGVSEREVIFLEIGSPSSNFVIANQTDDPFETGQSINFDASYSRSDNGAITSYTWEVNDEESVTTGSSSWSYTPNAPGLYNVSLRVTDAVGEVDEDDKTFIVESRAPEACFTYEFPYETQPGTAVFRNCSVDPDPNDELAYAWNIANAEYLEGTTNASEEPVVRFIRKGQQRVALTVNDQYIEQALQKEDTLIEEFTLDSILDLDLGTVDGSAYQLDEETGIANVGFKVTSENAVAVELDYGDGVKEEKAENGVVLFSHDYREAGVYIVEATVYDEEDEDNSTTRRIFIGEANAPLPVLELKVGDNLIEIPESGPIEVPRKTSITFDGSESLNTDGTGRDLIYLTSFGDGSISSTKESTHIYEDTGIYEVKFTVTDEETGEYSTIPLALEVVDTDPVIHGLSSSIVSSSLETPVRISASVDAEDNDGDILQYTWTFFDADNSSNVLETRVTNVDDVEITFHGLGTTGEEHRVGVCIKIKDDGDNEADSCPEGPYTYVMTVTGQNEPPRADFSIADTNVKVGDPVVFYDESTDDNEIEFIWYDVDGDGFDEADKTTERSKVHIYEKIGAYDTRVKVIDVNEATSVSGKKTVYVESSVKEPVAKMGYEINYLTVEFTDNSEVDDDTELESRVWDFDTKVDSDNDGDSANDIDSTEEAPTYTYDSSGKHEVKLTITDMQGNVDEVEKGIRTEAEPLEARMTFDPPVDPSDDFIHLQGDSGQIRVDFSGSTGPIIEYVIDGNTYFDSDGNGNGRGDGEDDDRDQVFTAPREALLYYEKEWQPIVIRLTIYDKDGNEDFASKQVIFDTPPAPPPATPPVPPVTSDEDETS
ncbi:PKD domain-containing protein [Candidatus Peregrinibacteria bacterium]|nr:PKD domain-containing protein [Candidatus Peregrinibacteria bacterium]